MSAVFANVLVAGKGNTNCTTPRLVPVSTNCSVAATDAPLVAAVNVNAFVTVEPPAMRVP